MAVQAALLHQLLELGETTRVAIAHALLVSVYGDDGLSAEARRQLEAEIERSFKEIAAEKAVPLDEALAWLRAKRTTGATR